MSRPEDPERGDWAYIPAFTFALALLGAVALALDGQAVAAGRAQLWAATATAARASVRCLARGTGTAADACVLQVTATLVGENLDTTDLVPLSVSVQRVSADSMRVATTAALSMPVNLPGGPGPFRLTAEATAVLVPAPHAPETAPAIDS